MNEPSSGGRSLSMRFCSSPCVWVDHYDAVQMCAVVLLYLQVACALVGSLGAVYTGIVLANLALALFALIAIESGSQSLGRAYAGLLSLSLLLDIVWFGLFTNEIRHFWNETQLGKFGDLSVKIMFWMQVSGTVLRFISSFLWCQMYRLGAMSDTLVLSQESVDLDGRIVNLGPYISSSGNATAAAAAPGDDRESEVLGGSIYDRAAFSSLCESFSRMDDLGVESNDQRSEDESQLQSPLLHCEP